jgi:hypothetical protein
MALMGNGCREFVNGRLFGGTAISGHVPTVLEVEGHRAARMRNQFAGGGGYLGIASLPNGARHPLAWVMAQKGGGMASRNVTELAITGSGVAYGGITTTGSTTIQISFANAAGELISSGSGSASMSFNFANALLTASLNGTGSASFTLLTNTPLLGAKADGLGSATFAITGTLTPYARGFMVGSTVDTSTVVNANIVSVNGFAVTGNGQTGTEWGPV